MAKEIAKNIPPPEPGVETWVYGLLVLSGYIFAGVMFYTGQQKEKELQASLSSLNDTMVATKVYLEGRAVQDQRIEQLKEILIKMESSINNLDSSN